MESVILTVLWGAYFLIGIYVIWGKNAKYRYRRLKRVMMYLVLADEFKIHNLDCIPWNDFAFQSIMEEIGVTDQTIRMIKDDFRSVDIKRDSKHYNTFHALCFLYEELKKLDNICVAHLGELIQNYHSATTYIRKVFLCRYKDALYNNRQLHAEEVFRNSLLEFSQVITNELYCDDSSYIQVEAIYDIEKVREYCIRY